MARLEPRKNLIDLKNKFSQKKSLSEFKRLYSNLGEEMHNYSSREKLKGGEYETMIAELAILSRVIDEYKPSHIEYTGGPNSFKDGVLYFNEKTRQDVEIVSITDKKEKISYRNTLGYELVTPGVSIPSVMKRFNWSEDQARSYLKSLSMNKQPLIEDFLYGKIVSVLEKKGKEKYKGFWLLIAYSPYFYTERLSEEERRDFILKKIQSEKKELVCSIRKIFKKVVFVSFNKEQGNHQVFEWNI